MKKFTHPFMQLLVLALWALVMMVVAVLIGVAIAASSAMILPISTPPNALAFATGFVKQKDMSKLGLLMGIISIVLGFGLVYLMGTLHLL